MEKCGTIGMSDAERKLLLRLRSLGDGVHLLSVTREHGDCVAVTILSDSKKLERLSSKTE